MLVVPFRPSHLEQLQIQPVQEYVLKQAGALKPYGKFLAQGRAFTGIDVEKNLIVGMAGVHEIHEGFGQCWALFGDLKEYKRPIFVAVRKFLDGVLDEEHYYNRVQMSVLEDHKEGELFARHLGFKKECLMEAYGTMGENHWLYARITKNDPKYRPMRNKE